MNNRSKDVTTPAAREAAWRIARACVTGTAHRAQDQDGQDRFVGELIVSGCGEAVAVLAVSDGAGSASHSGPAAQFAVDCFIDCVFATLKHARVADLPEETPRTWLDTIRQCVLAQAASAGQPPGEFSSTFLGVVAGEDATIFLQLGDGFIAVRRGGGGVDAAPGTWELACTPQNGEFINQTWFLTSPDALERTEIRRSTDDISGIAVTTDGLISVCLDRETGQPFETFFDALSATLRDTPAEQEDLLDPGLERFLASERLNAYTSDDKTLVLAIRMARSA